MIKWRPFCHFLCHGMDSGTIPVSHYWIAWNQIQLYPQVTVTLKDIPETIFCPYDGKVGEQLLRCCLKKVEHCLNSIVKLRMLVNTKKMSFYRKIIKY